MAERMVLGFFSGASRTKAFVLRQFQIDGEPVRKQTGLLYQPWACFRNGLEMDVARKAM
jgi:hypothetical protein